MARIDMDLVDRLHASGLRRRLAKAIAGAQGGSKRRKSVAERTVQELRAATETIQDEVLGRSRKRSEAAKKAARTRKRNAEKAKAKPKAKAKAKSGGRAKTRAG